MPRREEKDLTQISRAKNNRKDPHGFTLIEIMGVLLIITLILGMAIPGIRSQYRYYIRSSARKLAATMAFLYDSAVLNQRTYRIVYDLDNHKYWIESAAGELLIKEKEEEEAFQLDKEDEEEEGSKPKFQKPEGKLGKETKLQKGVKFKSVILPRYEEPFTSGITYTYILPQGYVEETWIQLTDQEEKVYTITVNSLTGRTKIFPRLEGPREK